MLDREKIQRMTTELETFAREHDEIYLIPEELTGELPALFRRLNIKIRATILDNNFSIIVRNSFVNNPLHKEIQSLPVMKTVDATKNFSERTGIITVVKKPLPIIQTELTFIVNNRPLQIPTFILSPDEILAIYDRLTVFGILDRFNEDGLVKWRNVPDIATKVIRGLNTFLESYSSNISLRFPDKLANNFKYEFDDAAIVVQGPIVYENNYTAETIKFYRLIYPNAPIVVSTWKNEATKIFRDVCRENSVVLLENVPPEYAGPFNVNMQLESSLQGVKFIRENTAAKFVMKTRCDQRINKPDFLTWFKNLILVFSPFGDKLRGRILLLEGSKWIPFHTADFLSFGYVEDIFKLYDIPRHGGEKDFLYRFKINNDRLMRLKYGLHRCKKLNYISSARDKKKILQLNRIMNQIGSPETYILRNFYGKCIGTLDNDKLLAMSWKLMRDYLVIIAAADISMEWPKYETDNSYSVIIDDNFNEIGFSRWLDLYRNFNSFGLD